MVLTGQLGLLESHGPNQTIQSTLEKEPAKRWTTLDSVLSCQQGLLVPTGNLKKLFKLA